MVDQALLDLADELDDLAAKVDSTNYKQLSAQAAQIARRATRPT